MGKETVMGKETTAGKETQLEKEATMGKKKQAGKETVMGKETTMTKETGAENAPAVKSVSLRRKKVLCTIYVVVAFIMISLPLVSMPLRLDKEGYEKRALSAMPRLFEDGKSVLEFPSRFDTYFSENFGLRSYMISLYSRLVYNLIGDSINDKVIAGKDGWLFFHETLNDYTNGSGLGTDELNLFYRSLYLQYEYLSERDIGFIFMVAPNKNSIYGEYMPQRYRKSPGKTNLELLNELLPSGRVPFINLQELLLANKDKQQLYHKKDTHWNNYGAMLAYREIMKKASGIIGQFNYDDFADNSYIIEKNWDGDLETMLLPAFSGKDYQVVFDKEPLYRFTRPMRTYEDMLIETESTVNDKRLLLFRDSFANALIPFLSDAFGYACYSRAVPFNYNLVERVNPDIVIIEIAERNLLRLLETAPLITAPLRHGFPDSFTTTGRIKVDMDIDREGQYVKIHGNVFFLEPLTGIQEIYISLINETGRYNFEAFPVWGGQTGDLSLEGTTPVSNVQAADTDLQGATLAIDMKTEETGFEGAVPTLNGQAEDAGFKGAAADIGDASSNNLANKLGFSMLLDEKGIPAGEYEIRIVLKTEQGYLEQYGEGSIHSFQ